MSLLADRLSAQGLSGTPADTPGAVVRRLLAVQAQDPRAAYLALRARSEGLSAARVDRIAREERALIVTWLCRGTLHLVCSEDYGWLQALTAPRLRAANARRLGQEGVSQDEAERGVSLITKTLSEEGPLSRRALRDRMEAAGVRVEGQAFIHILMLASIRGLVVRVPSLGETETVVLVHDWLGRTAKVDPRVALAELGRRYLAGHGPANARDLAKWAGLPLRDARSAFAAVGSELREREDGLITLKGMRQREGLPAPRLLGPFEPLLLGWSSRELVAGADEKRLISGGVFRAFALVRGRAAATWKLTRPSLDLDTFADLSADELKALEADAADVARFLGENALAGRGRG